MVRIGLIGATSLVSVSSLVWYRTYPLTSFYSEWLALVCGLVLACSLVLIPRNSALRLPGLAVGFFLLTLVMGLQLVIMDLVYPERSLISMLYAAWCGIVIMAAANLRDRVDLEVIAIWVQTGFWIAGFLVALSGFAQFYSLDTIFGRIFTVESGRGMIGLVGQRNYFANVVACGVVSLVYLWARGRLGTLAALLTGVPMLMALSMSSSRSAFAFLVILLAVVLVFLRGAGPQGRRLAWAAGLALAAYLSLQTLVSYLPASPDGDNQIVTATERLIESASGSSLYKVRERLYQYAWAIFLAHPLIGAGVGEYAWESFQLATRLGGEALQGIDRNAHNFILHLLAETGIVGTACILVPLGAWFLRFPVRSAGPDEAWLLVIVLMQLAQGSVELPLWYANLLAFLVLALGLGARGGVLLPFDGVRRVVIAALIVAGVLTAAGLFRDYRTIENWMQRVWKTEKTEGRVLGSQIEELQQLHSRSIYAPLMELLAAELMVVEGGDMDAKFELNRRVMHFFPTPGTALRETIYLSNKGRRDEAWTVFQAARIVYPGRVPRMMEELADYEIRNRGSITWLLDRVAAELKSQPGRNP